MFGPFFQAGLASRDIQRQIEGELGSEGLRGQVLQFSFVI